MWRNITREKWSLGGVTIDKSIPAIRSISLVEKVKLWREISDEKNEFPHKFPHCNI
jgi:hypothetical protein